MVIFSGIPGILQHLKKMLIILLSIFYVSRGKYALLAIRRKIKDSNPHVSKYALVVGKKY